MTTATQINSALADLVADGARLNSIINSDASTDVTLEDGVTTAPSVLKLWASISNKWRSPCRLATTSVLPNTPTYANGTSGLGATLTAGSNGALTLDGSAVANGDRVLIAGQATAAQNGIYTVTDLGSAGTPYVLTRATDADTNADLVLGLATGIQAGTTYAGAIFMLGSPTTGSITVGTTSLSFVTQPYNISAANLAGIDQNIRLAKTAAYTVTDADAGSVIELGGSALYTLTYPAASTLLAKHRTTVINIDTVRWKKVDLNGTTVWLAPGQQTTVRNVNSTYRYTEPGQWRLQGNLTLYVSETSGSTSNDGAVTGSPLTVEEAKKRLRFWIDQNSYSAIIQLNDDTYTSFGTFAGHWSGAHLVTVNGNSANPTLTHLDVPNSSDGAYCKDFTAVTFSNIYITGGAGSRGIIAEQFAIADVGTVVLGAFGALSSGLTALRGGSLGLNGVITLAGNIPFPIVAIAAQFLLGPWTHQVPGGGITVTTFASASLGGKILYDPGYGWGGAGAASVTGKKHEGVAGAQISTGGADFPGGTIGTVDATSFFN